MAQVIAPEKLREDVRTAQKELDALRASLESRLAALETAFNDPSQIESLPSRVMDLSRIATEEAQAAARRVCLETQLDAETRMAAVRAAAQKAVDAERGALEQERAAGGVVRRKLEETQVVAADARRLIEELEQQRALLEREAVESRAAHERQAAALEQERASARALQQSVHDSEKTLADMRAAFDDARAKLDRALAESAATQQKQTTELTALRRQLEEAAQRRAELERDVAESRTIREQQTTALAETRAELAGTRTAVEDTRIALDAAQGALGERDAALSKTRAALDASNTTLASTREELDKARADLSDARANIESSRAAHEETSERLAETQEALANARAALEREWEAAAGVMGSLENVRRSMQDCEQDRVRLEREVAEARAGVLAEREETARVHQMLEDANRQREALEARFQSLDDQRIGAERALKEAEARYLAVAESGGSLAEPPLDESIADIEEVAALEAAAASFGGEEPMVERSVRQVSRYVLKEDIPVLIDGEPVRLIDISTRGLQVLSTKTLKPNSSVKIRLPLGDLEIAGRGRVVWAQLEPPTRNAALRYRAGLRFTTIDESAIATFIAEYAQQPQRE